MRGRTLIWVKIRASEAERAEWRRQGGSSRRWVIAVGVWCAGQLARVRTWTVSRTPKLERKRTRELARIGANLNQIARWANIHKENAEVVEVAAHLVAIERALDTLTVEGEPR